MANAAAVDSTTQPTVSGAGGASGTEGSTSVPGTHTDLTGECAPNADCLEGLVLDGVHWKVLCSTEVRESAVAATEVAADDDAGVILNAVVGYDPSDVLG
jgi:hypothetical protein